MKGGCWSNVYYVLCLVVMLVYLEKYAHCKYTTQEYVYLMGWLRKSNVIVYYDDVCFYIPRNIKNILLTSESATCISLYRSVCNASMRLWSSTTCQLQLPGWNMLPYPADKRVLLAWCWPLVAVPGFGIYLQLSSFLRDITLRNFIPSDRRALW